MLLTFRSVLLAGNAIVIHELQARRTMHLGWKWAFKGQLLFLEKQVLNFQLSFCFLSLEPGDEGRQFDLSFL